MLCVIAGRVGEQYLNDLFRVPVLYTMCVGDEG